MHVCVCVSSLYVMCENHDLLCCVYNLIDFRVFVLWNLSDLMEFCWICVLVVVRFEHIVESFCDLFDLLGDGISGFKMENI